MPIGLIFLAVCPIWLLIRLVDVLCLRQEEYPNWTPSEFGRWRAIRLTSISFYMLFFVNAWLFILFGVLFGSHNYPPIYGLVWILGVGTLFLIIGKIFEDKAKKMAVALPSGKTQSAGAVQNGALTLGATPGGDMGGVEKNQNASPALDAANRTDTNVVTEVYREQAEKPKGWRMLYRFLAVLAGLIAALLIASALNVGVDSGDVLTAWILRLVGIVFAGLCLLFLWLGGVKIRII
jgi:hypothetical protein